MSAFPEKPPIAANTNWFVFLEWFKKIAYFVRALSSTYVVSGGIGYTSITFDYTLALVDFLVEVDCSNGVHIITLPPALGIAGKPYSIKKVDTTGSPIQVISLGGTIDGETSQYIYGPNDAMYVISDGTNWKII